MIELGIYQEDNHDYWNVFNDMGNGYYEVHWYNSEMTNKLHEIDIKKMKKLNKLETIKFILKYRV